MKLFISKIQSKYFISCFVLIFFCILFLTINKYVRNNNFYIAGIVNHHLLAKDIIDGFFKEASKFKYKNIVIVSPDHFNMCSIYSDEFLSSEKYS